MIYLYFICIIFFNSSVFSQHYKVMVGDEQVTINYLKGYGKTFIHIHHNEHVALQAAQEVIKHQGGSLISLSHSGGRNIIFHLAHKRYEFDPNRIFTKNGIKRTLIQYGGYSYAAYQEVNKLAQQIKSLLPAGKIVAVHNNATYSFKEYLPGHSLAQDAQAFYFPLPRYYRNFYFVTKIGDFFRLKSQGFNSILQKKSVTDDGSLSVYLAHNIYINVEAGYDQLPYQVKMLQRA